MPMTLVHRLSDRFNALTKRFCRDRRGTYLILLAMMTIPMVGAVGLAVDTGRGYLVKSKLSYALDAAGLAAGQMSPSADPTSEIQKYFDANFPKDYLGATVTGPTHTVSSDGRVVSVQVSATLDTTFLKVLGHHQLSISSSAEVTRATRPIDLVLAIDMSGSMRRSAGSTSRIAAARTAATTLVNALYGSAKTNPNIKVGIVPWSMKVNVTDGTSFDAAATTTTSVSSFKNPITGTSQSVVYKANNSAVPLLFRPTAGWPGCVYARYNKGYSSSSSSQADDDYGPGTYGSLDWEGWEPTVYGTYGYSSSRSGSDDDDDDGGGRKYGCTSGSCANDKVCPSASISPLQSNRDDILADINALTKPTGRTVIAQGLAWAWRVLLPDAPFTEATANPDPVPTRMIVLLTDGNNSGYSRDAYKGALNDRNLDTRLRNVATAIKAQGIEVVTIQFANSGSALQTLMQGIASSTTAPHYFHAPDPASLTAAFKRIGEYVSSVYLSK